VFQGQAPKYIIITNLLTPASQHTFPVTSTIILQLKLKSCRKQATEQVKGHFPLLHSVRGIGFFVPCCLGPGGR